MPFCSSCIKLARENAEILEKLQWAYKELDQWQRLAMRLRNVLDKVGLRNVESIKDISNNDIRFRKFL